MSLVPIMQPPIMRLLTTQKERTIVMGGVKRTVSRRTKLIFPIMVVIVGSIIAPQGTPLLGMIMLGNLLREAGVVDRLRQASENEIANIVTLLLGISIGATMQAEIFLRYQTLLILVLGFLAICLDTATGVLFGKLMCVLSGGKINPLIGAAGISRVPDGRARGPGGGPEVQQEELPPDARHGRQYRRADRLGHRRGDHAIGAARPRLRRMRSCCAGEPCRRRERS